MMPRSTHAMTPYPAARRVKKVVNCIFGLVILFIFRKKLCGLERLCHNVKIEGITPV